MVGKLKPPTAGEILASIEHARRVAFGSTSEAFPRTDDAGYQFESALFEQLEELFPEAENRSDFAFILRHDNEDVPPARYQWFVRSIEGEVNFSHDMPFSASIALGDNGDVIAGVVYDLSSGGSIHSRYGERGVPCLPRRNQGEAPRR